MGCRGKRPRNVDSKLQQFVAEIVAPKVSHAIVPQVRLMFGTLSTPWQHLLVEVLRPWGCV